MNTHRIDKIITAISAISIVDPGDYRGSPGSPFVGSKGDFPSNKVKMQPFVDKTGNVQEVPFLPGQSLRGAMRTTAAEIVMKRLKERGQAAKGRELYYCLMAGAASSQPDGIPPTLSESVFAAKNPFVGSYGGGPRLVWGRLLIGHAMPITTETVAVGIVPEAYAMEAAVTKRPLTDIMWGVKKDPLKINRGVLPIIIENPEEVAAAWLAELAVAKKKREDEMAKKKAAQETGEKPEEDSKKKDISTVFGMNVILPGVKFHARDYLDTTLAGDKMLGLYALTLAAFANEQRLGGGAAKGNGRFVITATCTTDANETFPVIEAVDGKYAPAAVPQIQAAVASWDEYAQSVTIEDFEKAFSLRS